MQLKKELSALVEKQTWNRVILRIIDTTWNIGHNFRLKDKQKTLMKYGVVYKLTCSSGSSYIGQTRRNLINRLKGHSSSDKSEVCRRHSLRRCNTTASLMKRLQWRFDFLKKFCARLWLLQILRIQGNSHLPIATQQHQWQNCSSSKTHQKSWNTGIVASYHHKSFSKLN